MTPDRPRPQRIGLPARDQVHMKLPDDVADGCHVQFSQRVMCLRTRDTAAISSVSRAASASPDQKSRQRGAARDEQQPRKEASSIASTRQSARSPIRTCVVFKLRVKRPSGF